MHDCGLCRVFSTFDRFYEGCVDIDLVKCRRSADHRDARNNCGTHGGKSSISMSIVVELKGSDGLSDKLGFRILSFRVLLVLLEKEEKFIPCAINYANIGFGMSRG